MVNKTDSSVITAEYGLYNLYCTRWSHLRFVCISSMTKTYNECTEDGNKAEKSIKYNSKKKGFRKYSPEQATWFKKTKRNY